VITGHASHASPVNVSEQERHPTIHCKIDRPGLVQVMVLVGTGKVGNMREAKFAKPAIASDKKHKALLSTKEHHKHQQHYLAACRSVPERMA